jgi:hypothetical protein
LAVLAKGFSLPRSLLNVGELALRFTPRLISCGLSVLFALAACSSRGSQSAIPSLGDGAPAPTVTGQRLPAASATTLGIPGHIPVWAYDQYWGQGGTVPGASVRQYITYAEGGSGNAKALTDCSPSPKSCYSVWYFEPNIIHASSLCPDPLFTPFISAAAENWYVHESGYTDFAHRVHGDQAMTCSRGRTTEYYYAANDANPYVQSFYRSYLQTNADAWDYYFMDDTEGTVVFQMDGPSGGLCPGSYHNYCTSTEELPTNASIVLEHASFVKALNHRSGAAMRFFFNDISFAGTGPANDLSLLSASGRLVGGVCENCIVDNNLIRSNMYNTVLNAIAVADAIPGAQFVELNNGSEPSGSSAQIAQRLITTAVAWLGFSPGHTVVWPNLEDNTDNLAAWPEDQLYPTYPVETMSTAGASTIEVASGVYRREFSACYYKSVAIGQCAAILNANGTSVLIQRGWLRESYSHVLALGGGDIVHYGGVFWDAYRSGSTYLPAGEAILLGR